MSNFIPPTRFAAFVREHDERITCLLHAYDRSCGVKAALKELRTFNRSFFRATFGRWPTDLELAAMETE